jgi:dTDP-4-amino-4,6-dideoxygalactose transaminase
MASGSDSTSDRPAVLGGTPVRAGKRWPPWPQWDDDERRRLAETLESGAWWSGAGDRAATFAAAFAAFQDARFGLALTNGTHTMEAALAACEVGEGDEVIVPGLTFVATATAVLAVNATPVIVDVDRASLCIDVDACAAAITPRTRAVIAVHVAGAACDLDALVDLCTRRGVHLIEDCAHAHGTRWRGRGAGSFGTFGSFSFQQSKLMTAGEGGALVTDDAARRAAALSYVNCGRVEGGPGYHHPTYGSNLRMTEWQGAILLAQLDRFPEQHRVRNARMRELDAALVDVPGLVPQARDPRMGSQGGYCYVFHYDRSEFAGLSLEGFERALAAEGIAMSVAYPSLNTVALFRDGRFGPRLRASAAAIDYAALELPRSECAAASTVWLEHRMLLADSDDVLDIVRAAARIHRHAGACAAALHARQD